MSREEFVFGHVNKLQIYIDVTSVSHKTTLLGENLVRTLSELGVFTYKGCLKGNDPFATL